MVMILFGRLWTNPMMTPVKPGGGSLHFYNSSFVTTTEDGKLKIQALSDRTEWDRYDHVKKMWKHEKTFFKSGMVQSWEKFCFTGGIVEVDIISPVTPSLAACGPLSGCWRDSGRATYEASTNNIWPWSFNKCDRKLQPAQYFSLQRTEPLRNAPVSGTWSDRD
jgi:beta-glucanase (GH16 family)